MQSVEVLTRYKWLMAEAEAIMSQADKLIRIGPAGVAGQAISGMPRGTNDADSAGVQAYDGYIQQLRERAEEIGGISRLFENVMAQFKNDRDRVICRLYYGVDMTDEQIGIKLNMDTSTVNRVRNDALSKIA